MVAGRIIADSIKQDFGIVLIQFALASSRIIGYELSGRGVVAADDYHVLRRTGLGVIGVRQNLAIHWSYHQITPGQLGNNIIYAYVFHQVGFIVFKIIFKNPINRVLGGDIPVFAVFFLQPI